jgi:diketogulonate reductase-like aldo/keto reductase
LYENHATTATTGSQRRGRKALSRDSGGARQLGISNQYDLADFSRMFAEARVKPAVLQNRFYATSGYDVDLRRFCTENGVVYQSFWTLTANRDVLFDEARGGGVKSGSADEARRLAMRGAVAAAAAANGKTPAQV